ncbi:translocation protein SEC62 isoform X2 [Condylostylus longicornis]|uniref:translocation protein SEC62 isoform X2 n=1 Tax=Condylostylus longicornis TaxID=2530218 RepID=UPI00244E4426|nr:translocation protein SEC62 isoform X2 [Condylostylus longicornis]
MSKRVRRRKDEYTGPEEQEPTKDEYNVAKWLRRNVKTKKTKFLSHNVEYFTANKALDALMSSKFAEGDNPLFPSREHAINFLHIMLEHKFFHRAKKVPVYSDELKSSKKKIQSGDVSSSESKSQHKETSCNKDDKHDKNTDHDSYAEGVGGGGAISGSQDENGEKQNKEKRKRKIKLDMHADQQFVDGSEAYVWIYDPIPIHYWIFGLILVLGAIVVCLFPLWPPILRKGVYYLSIAAAGFLVFILVLTIIRLIVFVIIWILSGGKLYFWIFPNLTEDVGFFASFWPLYETKYHSDIENAKANKKTKKKKKDKDSDAEVEAEAEAEIEVENEAEDITPLLEEKIEAVKEHDAEHDEELAHLQHCEEFRRSEEFRRTQSSESSNKQTNKSTEKKGSATESESESGSRSSTGKDFEMVDENDVDTS